MSTNINIPQLLLTAIENKAKKLKISRNKFIVMLLKKEVLSQWPEHFLNKKLTTNKKLSDAVDEMMNAIRSGRVNKEAIRL